MVITGLGLVTPVGIGVQKSWESFIHGCDGANEMKSFDTSQYKVHRSCEVKDFHLDVELENQIKENTIHKYVYYAAREALQESGLSHDKSSFNKERFGIAMGTLAAELTPHERLLRLHTSKKDNGFDKIVAAVYPPNSITNILAQYFHFEGPTMVSLNACSSGNHAIAWAYDLLIENKVDVVMVGGGDMIPQTEFTHFHNLKALAPEHCQPFDKNRQGLMIGEGAGILIMERYEFARKRGAVIIAEMAGYGLSCDGFHMTAPHPEGEGAVKCMGDALKMARLSPSDIGYINAHGTGTPHNDKAETIAIKHLFRDHAYNIPCSSTKSMIGHLMGAASAVESVICCLALRYGILPPTIHYHTPDPECDLDYIPNRARELTVKHVLNNSFAFGGNNATTIFSKIE
ncbi:beta-ketoacyl-[acyl-carrier-protein] synthase family protein [Candidatus Jettenia sp. AMX1]|uniref:beta-ketoacyl-[acyl-carrier-protein] synthase family protein n=1 Tax=Candidatus Jettenia sp. AMX1 TaxID=2293637 RepID=UPI0025574362|nr:beta-ketoacyl-[acyl-carrier-protein] synthase family protein [Candidatus Jettenia sp. AMX1]WKZ14862.1 MAG: beta-ketoacyl-[acyl-carrier-protein] synthase family protein [Candidatus Jettenia caeni]